MEKDNIESGILLILRSPNFKGRVQNRRQAACMPRLSLNVAQLANHAVAQFARLTLQ